jgi:acyl-CoA thioester hydrolase
MSQTAPKTAPQTSDRCSQKPLTHYCTYRVIYADTDNMGMAYHANYLRWMEIGRTELFRAWGLSYKKIEEKGIMLPVSEVTLKFVSSARYDMIMLIETTLDRQVKGGIKFDYRIFEKATDKLLAHGHTKHACVNADGRVVRPPKFLTDLIDTRLSPTVA